MITRVVHCAHERYDVYVGRPSMWGNPYTVRGEADRARAIAFYVKWIVNQRDLLAQVGQLRGKVLGCHCYPRACHGQVLALLADGVPPDCIDLFF